VEGPYRQGERKYLTEAAAQNYGDAILNSKKEAYRITSHFADNASELEEEMV